ncbi:helix-turn-helix domain-containing protein [Pseudomonas petrae]|uniref:Helix-turn-helix domain-containing protein n=1 Tax=Pseudomonas petrae TaxID=2912190 RepID=A0ABS9I396_9PSED|nr:helix-turn-helix domain-containing protein [Pseudomonas petrae]MCF7533788.1 helix-turn-helix domain-containing protein [Pseudomonas petrae]MCF7538335.1 helix-turn-helix domain-containing protein [Pseudomonas petrae]MCF7542255.1 helix-turn-helix domain-containing protein [Pseudomonas petrae]MCF7555700.1 helix-turn-helix domain-containing protein [Pseudomonas petrae]
MSEEFCKIPLDLLTAKHFISRTTCEIIPINAQDKILWAWMKKRHDYFTKKLGNPWFDNQADIAYACGCDLSTVKRFVGKMTKHGYLAIEKRKIHGCAFSNSMTITHDLVLAPVAPHKAIPKPVVVIPDPECERVPEYAPIALPKVAKPTLSLVVMATVPDVDDDAYDDSPPWMRDAG